MGGILDIDGMWEIWGIWLGNDLVEMVSDCRTDRACWAFKVRDTIEAALMDIGTRADGPHGHS